MIILIVQTILLLVLSCYSFTVESQTKDEVEDKLIELGNPTPNAPCESETNETGVLDKTYHYLNTKFCQPAIWFDRFFVDERVTNDARAGTMIRWYNDFSWTEKEGAQFRTRFSAKVHLPKASAKLKLVFESETDDDVLGLFPPRDKEPKSTLGLRYDWYAKEQSSFNFKVTLKPSIAVRYRYSYPIAHDVLFRFTQRVYRRKDTLGERTQFDLEHAINQKFLIRWTNFAKYDDDIDHFELGSGINLYQYISPKKALNYKVSVTGYDKPELYVTNTQLSATYRQNIYRDWLFYEVKPEYNWSKDFKQDREQQATITLRLEFLFNNI